MNKAVTINNFQKIYNLDNPCDKMDYINIVERARQAKELLESNKSIYAVRIAIKQVTKDYRHKCSLDKYYKSNTTLEKILETEEVNYIVRREDLPYIDLLLDDSKDISM